MIGLCLRALAALALMFSLAISAILAQPRDDAAMRAFFSPPQGCSAPCFLGIRPGVTTADQAIAILRAQPWVGDVQPTGVISPVPNYTNIYWSWNGKQPDFIFDPSALSPPYLHVRGGIIQYIRVVTRIPYGETWLLMGVPGTGSMTIQNPLSAQKLYIHTAGYFGETVMVDTEVACPINLIAFWSAPIAINYNDGTLDYSMHRYDLARWFYRSTCT